MLNKLETSTRRRIVERLERLADNPRPHGVEKLTGPEQFYRIRVGDYRIVYEIQDQRLVVLIVRVAHRREVY